MMVITYVDMLHSTFVKNLVQLALAEDLAYGDITSSLIVPAEQTSRAEIVAKESFIVCGLPVIEVVLKEINSDLALKLKVEEGQQVDKGQVLAEIYGNTRSLLAVERTILNFLQRLSGIAVCTRNIVSLAPELMVLDTRKTTPGWRVLEKHAVKTGGGRNHRSSLGDMILIKNNHFDSSNSIATVMEKVMRLRPPYMTVEVEVRNIGELQQAAPFRPEVVMFDNMSDAEIVAALEFIRTKHPQIKVEVSGGLEPKDLARLSALGVSYVSMGSLIRNATNVDISMRIT